MKKNIDEEIKNGNIKLIKKSVTTYANFFLLYMTAVSVEDQFATLSKKNKY